MIIWGVVSIVSSVSSSSRAYRATRKPHQPSYSPYNNDGYVTEKYYDQNDDTHYLSFKNGDNSTEYEFGKKFIRKSDKNYDSDDGTHLEK